MSSAEWRGSQYHGGEFEVYQPSVLLIFFSIFEINLNLKFVTFPGPNYRYKMQTTYLSYLCHLHVHTEEANYGVNSGKKFTNVELKYNFFFA